MLGREKLEKANILRDEGSSPEDKNRTTDLEAAGKVTTFSREDCEIQTDEKRNMSRGRIHAYDLIELFEEEAVVVIR